MRNMSECQKSALMRLLVELMKTPVFGESSLDDCSTSGSSVSSLGSRVSPTLIAAPQQSLPCSLSLPSVASSGPVLPLRARNPPSVSACCSPGGAVTLQVRNVPSWLSQRQLLACFLNGVVPESHVTFFYAPTDISSRRNLGYAFVSFTCACSASSFRSEFSGKFMCGSPDGLTIIPATIQGLEDNMRNVLSNPTVRRIKNPLYMPLYRSPGGRFLSVQQA